MTNLATIIRTTKASDVIKDLSRENSALRYYISDLITEAYYKRRQGEDTISLKDQDLDNGGTYYITYDVEIDYYIADASDEDAGYIRIDYTIKTVDLNVNTISKWNSLYEEYEELEVTANQKVLIEKYLESTLELL